jgi:hypothetical protein
MDQSFKKFVKSKGLYEIIDNLSPSLKKHYDNGEKEIIRDELDRLYLDIEKDNGIDYCLIPWTVMGSSIAIGYVLSKVTGIENFYTFLKIGFLSSLLVPVIVSASRLYTTRKYHKNLNTLLESMD